MNQPLISVIIPVYNAAQYILATLQSVCSQSYSNLEIIIVDDSSTDNSYSIVKEFQDTRIILLHQPNSGAAVARNTGLKQAKGRYIQFMDADDLLHPDKIKLQVQALNGHTDQVAVSNYIEFFDHQNHLEKTIPVNQHLFIYTTNKPVDFLLNLWGANGTANFIQTNSWLVPRQLIDKAGMWRNYRCPDDDGEFFTRILLASSEIVYVPNAINYYRRFLTEGNLSNHKNPEALKNSFITIGLKKQYIEQHEKSPRVNKAFARQYLNFAVYNFMTNKPISQQAYAEYKKLNTKLPPPKIGGWVIQNLAHTLGWKFALNLKHLIS